MSNEKTNTSEALPPAPRFGWILQRGDLPPKRVRRRTTFRWRNMEFFTDRRRYGPGRPWSGNTYWMVTHARTGIALTCPRCCTESGAIEDAKVTLRSQYRTLAKLPTLKANREAPEPEASGS